MNRLVLACLALLLVANAQAKPRAASTRPAGGVEIVVSKVDLKPTLVTGKIKDQSASDMFFKLAQQAGGTIAPQDESLWDDPALVSASFSAEWDKQPFWDALVETCETTGLRTIVDLNRDTSGHLRIERCKSPAPTSIDGVALVRVEQLRRDATVSYADNNRSPEQMQLTLQLLLEPKLRGLAWINPPVIDKAEDEAGHALAMTTEKPRDEAGAIHGTALSTALNYPANAGTRIALLRGTIRAQVATEIASVRLPQPFGAGKEVAVNVGLSKLVFRSVSPNPDGSWNVSLTLDRGKKETFAHWRVTVRRFVAWPMSLSLSSPNGQFRPNGGSSGWGDNRAELSQSFVPSAAGDVPAELRVDLPLKFVPLDVKFEFKDLPMP